MEYLTSMLLFCIALTVPSVYTGTQSHCTVEIVGPIYFPTDGTRNLTLRAVTTNMGSSPDFSWGGLCSSYSDTCTIQPRLVDDGVEVFCTATDPVTVQAATARYVLNLKYPPFEAPDIASSTMTDVLSPGDVLTCTVSGGKPLVTSVSFSCTNPSLPDQNDVIDMDSVSSAITVDATGETFRLMNCTCFAIWSPEPGLYQKIQTKTFTVEMPPSSEKVTSSTSEMISSSTDTMFSPVDTKDNTTLIAATTGTLILGLIVGIAVIVIVYLRKKRSRAHHDNVESSIGKKELNPYNGVSSLPSKNEDEKQVSASPRPPAIVVATEDDQPGLQDQQMNSSYFSGSDQSMASTSSTGSDNSTSCLIK